MSIQEFQEYHKAYQQREAQRLAAEALARLNQQR